MKLNYATTKFRPTSDQDRAAPGWPRLLGCAPEFCTRNLQIFWRSLFFRCPVAKRSAGRTLNNGGAGLLESGWAGVVVFAGRVHPETTFQRKRANFAPIFGIWASAGIQLLTRRLRRRVYLLLSLVPCSSFFLSDSIENLSRPASHRAWTILCVPDCTRK